MKRTGSGQTEAKYHKPDSYCSFHFKSKITMLKKLLYFNLLYFALASTSFAQSLTLPKEISGKPGQFIPVKALTESKVVEWCCTTPGLSVFPSTLLKDARATVVIAVHPGKYHLQAIVWNTEEKRTGTIARCVIVVSGDPLPPQPNPPNPIPPVPDDPDPPKPKPNPPKVQSKIAFVISVMDAKKVKPAIAQVLADKSLREWWKSKSITYREFWKDAPAVNKYKLRPFLLANDQPTLIFMEKDGKVIGGTGHAIPETVAEIKALAEKLEK